MSALEHDPRVRKVDEHLYVVEGPADIYYVYTHEAHLSQWLTCLAYGGQSWRAANPSSMAEVEAWLKPATTVHDSSHAALTYALTRVGA